MDKSSWDQRAPGVQRQTPKLPYIYLKILVVHIGAGRTGRAGTSWQENDEEKGRNPPFILTEETYITLVLRHLLEMKFVKLPQSYINRQILWDPEQVSLPGLRASSLLYFRVKVIHNLIWDVYCNDVH